MYKQACEDLGYDFDKTVLSLVKAGNNGANFFNQYFSAVYNLIVDPSFWRDCSAEIIKQGYLKKETLSEVLSYFNRKDLIKKEKSILERIQMEILDYIDFKGKGKPPKKLEDINSPFISKELKKINVRYEIKGNKIRLTSPGPDRKFGTNDDIVVEFMYK
ncbi:MAG: hypothetical protein ABGX27_03395 [Desulfurobacteriaceae bacterium]